MKVPKAVLRLQKCRTRHEFILKKRRELRAVIKALEVFKWGCAYLPGYNHFTLRQISNALQAIQLQLKEPK